MGRGNLSKVRDGLGNPPKGPGRVWGPSQTSDMGRGPSGRFNTGRGTHPDVRDRLENTHGRLGWVGGPSRMSGTV